MGNHYSIFVIRYLIFDNRYSILGSEDSGMVHGSWLMEEDGFSRGERDVRKEPLRTLSLDFDGVEVREPLPN